MKMPLPRVVLFSVLLMALPGFLVAQEQLTSEPKLSPREAASLVKELASQELELEQSCRRIASIYREMAAPLASDSATVRELKHQYERLAENEDRAAAAAKKLAEHYARLTALLHDSSEVTKTRYLHGDAAYRR